MTRYFVVENRKGEIIYLGEGYEDIREAEGLLAIERAARANAGIHADLWIREEVDEC